MVQHTIRNRYNSEVTMYMNNQPEAGRELPEYLSIISGSQCARIMIDDIECIEQDGRRLHIVTPERDYVLYESMNSIVMSLAERAFFRPMKGLIINMDHVKDITGSFVNFYSGQSVSMGKNSISKVRAAYKKYLLKYPPYSLWEPRFNVAEVKGQIPPKTHTLHSGQRYKK